MLYVIFVNNIKKGNGTSMVFNLLLSLCVRVCVKFCLVKWLAKTSTSYLRASPSQL